MVTALAGGPAHIPSVCCNGSSSSGSAATTNRGRGTQAAGTKELIQLEDVAVAETLGGFCSEQAMTGIASQDGAARLVRP